MIKNLPQYKPGDTVTYMSVGYGVTTYETDVVVKQAGMSLFTRAFDRMSGLEWNGKTHKFDTGLGLVTFIVPNDDPKALKFLRENTNAT